MRRTETFFSDCVNAYGYEGAKSIGEAAVSAFQLGMSHLAFPDGVPRLGFGVFEPDELYADGLHSGDGIRFALRRTDSATDIATDLPKNVIHELAHASHFQNRPVDDHENWQSTLAGFIKEGIALSAERELCSGGYIVHFSQNVPPRIETALIEVMCGVAPARESDNNGYYAYLSGDDMVFPNRGYVTGQYVVGRYMIENRAGLGEVMQTPLGVFRQFIEERL